MGAGCVGVYVVYVGVCWCGCVGVCGRCVDTVIVLGMGVCGTVGVLVYSTKCVE